MSAHEQRSAAVRVEIEFELGRRLRTGALAHLALMATSVAASRLHGRGTSSEIALAVGVALINITRFALSRRQAAFYPERRALWMKLFTGSLTAVAVAWGLFALEVVRMRGLADVGTLGVLISVSGIASGSTTSLSPDVRLARLFVAALLAIPTFHLFVTGSRESMVFAINFAVFWGFLWVQAGLQGREFIAGLMHRLRDKEDWSRMRAVFDAIPGQVLWTDRELRIRGVNRFLAAAFGAGPGDFVGRKIADYSPGPEFIEAVSHFASSQEVQSTAEARIHVKEGPRWHLMVMRKTGAGPAADREIYIIAIDIEDLKRAEAAVADQKVKGELSSRLANLGEMAGGVVHEINNPLMIIMGAANQLVGLAGKNPIDAERVKQKAETIERTVTRMSQVLNALRAFANEAEEGPFREVALATIFDNVLQFNRERFRSHGIAFYVPPIDPGIKIECRPAQISQILLNVLGNAHDAVMLLPEKWVRLEILETNSELLVSIIDSGPGIPHELRTKVFQPFFSTKGVGKGVGLGLNVARGIAEAHSGSLELAVDALNTCFRLRLPKRHAAEGSEAA